MSSHHSHPTTSVDLATLARALRALPESQRVAVELRVLEGWSLEAISRRMCCPENEVVRLLRQALLGIASFSTTESLNPTVVFHLDQSANEQRLDLLLAEYLRACDTGSPPDRACLLQGHADLARELSWIFAGMDRLATGAEPLRRLLPSQLTLSLRDGGSTVEGPGKGVPRSISRVLPDFEIRDLLGEGGMGVVYLAWQRSLRREVALKMIRSSLSAGSPAVARFCDEAWAVARLNHPNIVQIYSVDSHDGEPYCVLEYVRGGTLTERLGGVAQDARRAAELTRTLALAMHVVHQQGIIHRDLKPGNVLLTEDGTPKISDFGLAKFLDQETPNTRPGGILGTPSYMAPEQALGRNQEVCPATDVYALGAMLYEMLTGRPPFRGESALATLEQVRTQDPTPVRSLNRGVPPDLETIVHKCLEKDPAHRYPSAEVLAERLQRFLDGEPIPERPRSWLKTVFRRFTQRLTLFTVLFLLVVSSLLAWIVLVAPSAPSSEDPRQAVARALATGKEFHFKGSEPLPGPFAFRYGEPSLLARAEGEAYFSGSSHGTTLWELLSEVEHDRYEFSAEVRHTAEMRPGTLVGLYFNYQEIPATELRLARGSYVTLGFSEANAAPKQPAPPQAQNWVALNTRLFERREIPYSPSGPITGLPFVPANPLVGPGPWRKLRVVVRPEEVTVDWEPISGQRQQIAVLTGQDLADRLSDLALSIPNLHDAPTTFRPRAGLGLIEVRASAAFRNVRLIPIPSNQ